MSGGRVGERRDRQRLDREAAAIGVERVGTVPADVGRAGDAAATFDDVDGVEANAAAFEAQAGGRRRKRLAVRRAVVDRHAAEAERPRVRTVQVEITRQRAVHRIVLEIERVEQVGQRAPLDPNARVDLLAAVAARVTEREEARHVDPRSAAGHHGLADVGVRVLDDDVALGVAPGHVERLHRPTAEAALDARPAKRAEEHAVELAGAIHLDRARRRRRTPSSGRRGSDRSPASSRS